MVVDAMFHVLVPSAVPSAWMKLGSFELAIEPPALSNNLSLPDSHNKYTPPRHSRYQPRMGA